MRLLTAWLILQNITISGKYSTPSCKIKSRSGLEMKLELQNPFLLPTGGSLTMISVSAPLLSCSTDSSSEVDAASWSYREKYNVTVNQGLLLFTMTVPYELRPQKRYTLTRIMCYLSKPKGDIKESYLYSISQWPAHTLILCSAPLSTRRVTTSPVLWKKLTAVWWGTSRRSFPSICRKSHYIDL